jgi:succinoglycan biosynthesis protein ExoA
MISAARVDESTASITVVMPVRNEERHIARTVEQLLCQRRDGIDVEILIVDGRSTDRTREIVNGIAKRHAEVRLFDNSRGLSSAARNIGIRHSRGEFVVIVDGHCEIPSQQYLRDVVDAFKSTGADCVGRPQPLDVTGASSLQCAIAAARASWLGHHPDSFIYSDEPRQAPAASVAAAYRRQVFEVVGLFDERFDACEDYELNHRIDRAGLRCVLDPRSTVKYHPRDTLRALFRQLYRYGRGRVRLAKKHPETFTWKSYLPAACLAGLVLGPVACYWTPALWWAYFGTISTYAAVVLSAAVYQALLHRSAAMVFWLPIVYATIHFGAAAGLLREMVHRFDSRPAMDAQSAATPSLSCVDMR